MKSKEMHVTIPSLAFIINFLFSFKKASAFFRWRVFSNLYWAFIPSSVAELIFCSSQSHIAHVSDLGYPKCMLKVLKIDQYDL